ncbi:MAG TPA: hypothetical protein VK970_07710 [Candidatus Methylacidiphilales bacterium]|nr:hypothetical protein [Candidatus Methylacidiphilales bacterium]
MRILITGARSPACLEWARLARRAGAEAVFVADSLAAPLARFSSTVTEYIRLPAARGDEPDRAAHTKAYGMALRDAAEQCRADVILPTCEEAFYISHQKALLSRHRPIVADFNMMARLHHKYDFQQLVKSLPAGIQAHVISPETHLLLDKRDVTKLARQKSKSEKWVLKPVWSRFATQTLVGLSTCELEQTCARLRIKPDTGAPWVAQEYIPGTENCSYSLLREGRLLAHVCYRPLYRAGTGTQGSGIYFQPIECREIAEFVRAFAASTAVTGQFAFDYIREAGPSGRIAVLECNPRATSGIHLLAGALDDISARRLLRDFLLGESCGEQVITSEAKPAMVTTAMLLFALPPALASSGLLSGAGNLRVLQEFGAHWSAAHDVIYAQGDALPALGQMPGFGEFAWNAISRRQSLLAATTADIEWNGESLN